MKKIILPFILLSISLLSFAQIPTDGLVAYYPFNGNANDMSGNGNNGMVNGATLTTDRFGKANSAYSFDGVNDLIDLSNQNLRIAGKNDRTFAIWVKTNKMNSCIMSTGMGVSGVPKSNAGKTFNIMINPTTPHLGLMGFSGGQSVCPSCDYFPNEGEVITDNKWKFIVVILKDSSLFTYVNGELDNNQAMPLLNTEGNSNFIGKSNHIGNENYFNGIIDDIRVYNRAVNANEITALYNENVKQNQTISSLPNLTKKYTDAPFTIKATATSSLAVNYASSNSNVATISGNTVTIKGAGTTTITASQAGNTTYNPAPNVTFTLTVQNPIITASGDITFCEGENVVLRAPKGFSSYSWTGGGNLDSLVVTKTGNSSVTINGKDISNSISITVKAKPIVSILNLTPTLDREAEKQALVGNPSGGTFIGLGMTNNVLDPKVGSLGTRTITYTYSENGCKSSAIAKTVIYKMDTLGTMCTIKDTLYIKTLITSTNNVTENYIKIYPNPASDYLIIDNGNYNMMSDYKVEIINALGQSVFNSSINQAQFTINLASWTKKSVYFVKVINPEGKVIETKKVVIE